MAIEGNDTYHSLLMDYAAGTLDEAHSLLVAAHLALSPAARRIVSSYEKVGGELLREYCSPCTMAEDALRSVFDRIDTLSEECAGKCADDDILCREMKAMPRCLRSYMEPDHGHLPWKDQHDIYSFITVKTTCRGTRADIVRMHRDMPLSAGHSYALVLEGDLLFQDRYYRRGDVLVLEEPDVKTLFLRSDSSLFLLVKSEAGGIFQRLKKILRKL